MKKIFVSLLCAVMLVTFMPSMAFASGVQTGDSGDGTNVEEQETPNTQVPENTITGDGEACPNGENCTDHAAAIGEKHYTTLEKALEAAGDNDTVVLLKNIEYSPNGQGLFNITKSITLDGREHTISGWGKRGNNNTTLAINYEGTSMIEVTLKNLRIKNGGPLGKAVETRGNIEALTIENCKFDCTDGVGNTQVLTVGGNQSTAVDITIDKTELTAGNAGYPIISFNPMNLTIRNGSKFSGYCGVYFKGVNGSEGSHGSVVNAADSSFDCPNVHDEAGSNNFGVFALEDDNITINLENCNIKAEVQGTANQAVLMESSYADRTSLGYKMNISGNSKVNGILLDAKTNWANKENCVLELTGGIYTLDPTKYVPNGYEVVENADETYTVQKYVPPYIPPVNPPASDNVTNDTDDKTTNADIDATVNADGKAEATVDKTTADKIVDKAVANGSAEITIDATTSAGKADAAEVRLPAETVAQLVEKTDADIIVKTDAAEVKLDQEAAKAITETASTGMVSMIVEKTKDESAEMRFELKVVTENGAVSDFKGGTAAVTVKLNDSLKDKELVCVYIDENGRYYKVKGEKDVLKGIFTFLTDHFSTYAIMETEAADRIIEEQTNARLKAGVENTTIKMYYNKKEIGKGWIKLRYKKSYGYKVDNYEIFRSAKKKTNFGDEAWFVTKTNKTKGFYKNGKSVKKGTRYYYKMRGVREIAGETVYTQWSNVVMRTGR